MSEAEKQAIGEVMDDLCRLADLLADSTELRVEETPAVSQINEAIEKLDRIIRPRKKA